MEKHLFKGIAEISISLSKDFPFGLKPFVAVFIYLVTLLATILVLPFIPFIVLANKFSNKSYWMLREDLEKIWYRQSSSDALLELRKIYEQIKSVSPGRKRISPYGRFNFMECYKLLVLLYNWEIHHGNWEKAIELCNETLQPVSRSPNNIAKKYEKEWIICKANCIENTKGNIKAREFLLRHIDPRDNNCTVKKYFEKLKHR